MSRSELIEHAGYFRDSEKLAAYTRALEQVVSPGDVVVDLGAGTGLLGLIAARAGAGRVYMLDAGPILGVAHEMAIAAGFGDRVVPVRGYSRDLTLPERADVIVCDQIGGLVYDAGVLEYFADARRRLLKPGGHLVPGRFRLYVAPVSAPDARDEVDVWAGSPAGFDSGPVLRLAQNTEWRVDGELTTPLAESALLAEIDAWSLDALDNDLEFVVQHEGRVDGLLGWFDAELAPGVRLTNNPRASPRMQRWCNFYPTMESMDVEPGDRLQARIKVRPEPGMVSWTVTWLRGDDQLARYRHSTVLGQFLDAGQIAAATEVGPIHVSAAGHAVGAALMRADGSLSSDEIVRAVLADNENAFVDSERGTHVLRRELGRWARTAR